MSEADRFGWTFEQVIEHACSLAMLCGAGRDDILPEYKAAKEMVLRMARRSRVRNPTVSDDDELEAAGGDHAIADLLRRWETEQSEWFTSPTLEIVAEYAAWREQDALADNDWFRRQYPAAVASGDWEAVARLLSGRLQQMEKRAVAANKRADALEMTNGLAKTQFDASSPTKAEP